MNDYAPLSPDPDALLELFRRAEKPRERHAIGTEWERAGLVARDLSPVPFEGDRGVHRLLVELAARYGWEPKPETPGGPVIALERGRASITLEPAAQLELSGAPLVTIHETAEELRVHLAEVDAVSAEFGIVWLGLGFHPLATHAELPWVPKGRYGVMRDYLPTRSTTGLDMMRRTQTVQANLDYVDEADAMRKLVTSLKLQPIVTAMFANSPWVEGVATGERSHRATVWLHMDPDRSGMLPSAFHEAPSYARYVEYALDVPMFIVKRGERVLRATHLTFRQFMRDGLEGERATFADWETHVNTLFPEVRLKRTLEMRGVDSQDRDLVPALPALFKGLLYDAEALDRAEALASRIPLDELHRARRLVPHEALRTPLAGRTMQAWAEDIIDIARSGLARIGDLDASGRDETQYLAELAALTERGLCPADRRLERAGTNADAAAIIAVSHA